MASRRGFMRILGASAVIVAAGGFGLTQCDPMPGEAVEAWMGPKPDQSDPRVRAISYALLCPNPHNKQPWIVDLKEPGVTTFYLDAERLLPQTDPPSRQIMIGCGAFLDLLEMAAAEEGFATQVQLFPQGPWPEGKTGPEAIARIVFAQGAATRNPLFAQVFKRQTNRSPYDATLLSNNEAQGIASAVQGLGLSFGSTSDGAQVATLSDLAARAWAIEIETDATYKESVDVMRITGEEILKHRDGISMHGPFFWWASKSGLFTRENAMEPENRKRAVDSAAGVFASTKNYAWLVSNANDRAAQIATGRAYLRANLKATEYGLAQQPLSQALQEFPEMAGPYAEIKRLLGVSEGATVQMFYRIGRAGRADLSPRRKLDAIIRS